MGILRFLLAASVLIGHTAPILGTKTRLVGGMTAVESFFIISGFYMALVLKEKYSKGDNAYRKFYFNRFLRLFPMYWTVLLVVLLVSLLWNFQHLDNHLLPYIKHFSHMNFVTFIYFIFSNMFLLGQDTFFFLSLNPDSGWLFFTKQYTTTAIWLEQFLFVPQAWTLGIEILFYLLAPFIFKLGWKFVLTIAVISLFTKICLFAVGLSFEPWPYRFFPAEICFFLAGAGSYLLYKRIRNKSIAKHIMWGIFGLVVFYTILYSLIPGLDIYSYNPYRIGYYILLLVAVPFLFKFTKKNAADTFIGRLSYPMYIVHLFIIQVYFTYYPGFATTSAYFSFAVLGASIIVSILLLLLVDNPVQKLKYKSKEKI